MGRAGLRSIIQSRVVSSSDDGIPHGPDDGSVGAEVVEKLAALEQVLEKWRREQASAEKKRERRWKIFLSKLGGLIVLSSGVVWTFCEMGAWYYDRCRIADMASRYSEIAKEMFDRENSPDVALDLVSKAIELDGDKFEYRFQEAYIKGARAIRVLLNLDRSLNKEELDTAHSALADAKFLKKLAPERAEGFILESQIYTALGEYDKAEAAISEAVRLAPDDAFAKVRFVTLLNARKRNEEALSLIEDVVSKNPDFKWGHLWHGLVLNALGRREEAVAAVEKSLDLDPKFDVALYNLACFRMNARPRQFEAAREYFRKALTVNPSYKEAYYQLGMSYGYQDNYDVALTYMNKAVELSGDYLTARSWRALVLFEMKRFKEAAEEYGEAIRLDPRNDKLYVRRAAAWAELKDYRSAVADLCFARELNPANVEALSSLGKVYLETGNLELALSKIDEAVSQTKKGTQLSELYRVRSEIHVKLGDSATALEDASRSIEAYKSKFSLMRRARLYCAAGEIEKAMQDIAETHRLDAKYAPAWKLEFQILRTGDPEAALEAAKTYLSLCPQDKDVLEEKMKLESETN